MSPLVVKNADGEWLIGTLDKKPTQLADMGGGRVIVAGSLVVLAVPGPADTSISIVDPHTLGIKALGRFPTSQYIRAVADSSGEVVYVHGSSLTQDNGVRSYVVATGETKTLIEESPISKDLAKRYQLTLSPSGGTLSSSFCDVDECHADVINTSDGATRHILEPFAGVAATDSTVLGLSSGGWLLYDLVQDRSVKLPNNTVDQVMAAYAVDNSHFLLDSLSIGHYAVFEVDAATGDLRTLMSQEGTFENPSAMLVNVWLPPGRWFLVGPDSSFESILSYGPGAKVQVLDRTDSSVVTEFTPFE